MLPHNEDFPLMNVLYHIVFHSLGSRVFKLRERDGLFYSASGSFGTNVTRVSPGMDFLVTSVEKTTVDTTIEKVKHLFAAMRDKPCITEHELCAAQRWYEDTVFRKLQRPAELCATVVRLQRLFPDAQYDDVIRRHLTAVQNVSLRAINELAQRVFRAPFDTIIVCN